MRRHRERAVRFYMKAIAGYVHDWIDTGNDDRGEVDKDVKDLAHEFRRVELDAVNTAIDYYEPDASPSHKSRMAITLECAQ